MKSFYSMLLVLVLGIGLMMPGRGFEVESLEASRELGGKSKGRLKRGIFGKNRFFNNCTGVELSTEEAEMCTAKAEAILNKTSIAECYDQFVALTTEEDVETYCDTGSCARKLKFAAFRMSKSDCACSDEAIAFKESVQELCSDDDDDGDDDGRLLRGSGHGKGKNSKSGYGKSCNSSSLTTEEIQNCSALVEDMLEDEEVATCVDVLESLESVNDTDTFCYSDSNSTSCNKVLKTAAKSLSKAGCRCADDVVDLRSTLTGICGSDGKRSNSSSKKNGSKKSGSKKNGSSSKSKNRGLMG